MRFWGPELRSTTTTRASQCISAVLQILRNDPCIRMSTTMHCAERPLTLSPSPGVPSKPVVGLLGWKHHSHALAEADAYRSRTLAPGAQPHLVSIFQERPLLARGQRDGLGAAARHLQQAATRSGICAGDRAASQQIAGPQITADRPRRSRRRPRAADLPRPRDRVAAGDPPQTVARPARETEPAHRR